MFRILHHWLSSNDCVGRLNPTSSVFSCVAWRTQHEALEMNLYRSFGNLMEAWLSEGAPDSEWPENNDEDSPLSSSDMETNLRSESVDSGVETPSSDLSFPVTSGSLSAEIDTFMAEKEDGLTSASTSQSPVLSSPATLRSSPSSSSPRLSQQQGSTALHLKLEQALQRTESKQENSETLTVDEVLRRRPRASVLPKRHTSDVVRGHRSESFSLRRTVSPLALVKQMSETQRRPQSMTFGKLPTQAIAEDFAGEQNTELSPGLMYLEQVCQMLEEIATKQMHNRVLQMEMEALQEHQELQILSQTLDTCQGDAEAKEDCQKPESTEVVQNSSDALQHKEYPNRHMRQRSASDTNLTTLHLRRLKADCRGQHMSTDDLLETTEENQDLQETKKEKRNKTPGSLGRNWRLKIVPLRREDSAKSQQMQPSERNSTRRRLSQLFRRRRKTVLS